jgi:hypothetical protein
MMMRDAGDWHVVDTGSGLPANDVSTVALDPNDDLWVGTEGWGLAVYRPRAAAPTATPPSGAPSPTPTTSATANATPTGPTATRPTPTPTRTGTRPARAHEALLPVCYQTERQ